MLTDAVTADLTTIFGRHFVTAQAVRAQHAQSETAIIAGQPDAVAYPSTTAEVAALVRICAAARVPVIGWGAGTSLEGHALAVRGGVTVDFARMNALLEVRAEDRLAIVQPGLTRVALNEGLRATGLMFPVDPGADASLGGMASTRASGTTAVRYGTMRDAVRALEVVLADGSVIRTGTGAPKSASGYDLTALFTGAEGTLGLITELTLRLHGQPEAVAAAACAFPTLEQAVDCVIATLAVGLPMARIEFLDAAAVAACNAFSGDNLPTLPHLLVEFHGSPMTIAEEERQFAALAADAGCSGYRRALKTEDRARLWKMRHDAYRACLALRPGATAIVTDVCVPLSQLAEAVTQTQADIEASGLPGPILGHVGDGNFHAILLVDPHSAADRAAADRLASRMATRALALGGTITGEHGIGLGKRSYMTAEHGDAWSVMGAIKHALDSYDLMNPGKLVPDRD